MNFGGLLFLVITQFLTGRGLLYLFNIKNKLLVSFALSCMLGVVTFSTLPMLLELFKQPINKTNVITSICVTTLLSNVFVIKRYDFSVFKNIKIKIPAPYEILFIGLTCILMIPSVWRCYYYPTPARDVLSGPEALSHYAILEHKISNSVFSVNLLASLPNLLKPPFITDLQIIYKLLVYPFGQVWLTILAISFLIWVYNILKDKLHPLLAGVLLLMFVSIPEVYGYSYVLLWDYSNMIFYSVAYYYLYQYIQNKKYSHFLFSCMLFGFATFIRVDTLIFIGLTTPVFFLYSFKEKIKISSIVYSIFLLLIIPFVFYYIWVGVFIKYYLPKGIELVNETNFSSVSIYFDWLNKMNAELVFGGDNLDLYGYFIYLFIIVVFIDLIAFRKFKKEAVFMLLGVAIIYFGMPLLSYFTNWFNITTAKRGLFKMFPLMLMYMRYSALFSRASEAIINFENPVVKPVNVKIAPVVRNTGSGKKKK